MKKREVGMNGAGNDLLLKALRDPRTVADLGTAEWDELLSQGRRAAILGRMYYRLEDLDLLSGLPDKAVETLAAERTLAEENEREVLWELNRIQRALSDTGVPVVALKGAAYAVAGLPPARGRLCSDVDILVEKQDLRVVEDSLLRHGWEPVKLDEYDQRYYRAWMHELPPLLHKDRDTIVDVHHALSPATSRLRPDSRLLLQAAVPIEGTLFRVLAPADMVLHSATHMFQDGDTDGAFRDLKDIDDLLRHFGKGSFWDELLNRAHVLGLERPLFYALRYAKRLLETPVPEHVTAAVRTEGPPWPFLPIMDATALRTLSMSQLTHPRLPVALAKWFLFVRAHWLRMPPLLLARHLLRKSFRRTHSETEETEAVQGHFAR